MKTLLFLSDFYKIGIKISRRYDSYWRTLICTEFGVVSEISRGNILTFTSDNERFLTCLYKLHANKLKVNRIIMRAIILSLGL